jgi:hypothetical protein
MVWLCLVTFEWQDDDGYENDAERAARRKRKKRAIDAAYTEHGHIEMQ